MKNISKILLIFIVVFCNAQDDDEFFNENFGVFTEKIDSSLWEKIKYVRFSESEGAIFPSKFTKTLIGQNKKAFDPDTATVKLAESELVKQYCTAHRNFNEKIKSNTLRNLYLSSDFKSIRDYKKQIQNEKRILKKYCTKWQNDVLQSDKQIIGYVNEKGEKLLWIKIVDFREDPYNLKPQFYTSWIDGSHGWFETNLEHMIFHLKDNRITVNP